MPRRETVTIDRRKLIKALDTVERALTEGNLTAALHALTAVYKLIPPPNDGTKRRPLASGR